MGAGVWGLGFSLGLILKDEISLLKQPLVQPFQPYSPGSKYRQDKHRRPPQHQHNHLRPLRQKPRMRPSNHNHADKSRSSDKRQRKQINERSR